MNQRVYLLEKERHTKKNSGKPKNAANFDLRNNSFKLCLVALLVGH